MKNSLLTLWLILLVASNANAHEIRPAYLKITSGEATSGMTSGTYDIVWKQPILDKKKLKIDPVLPPACERTGGGPGEVTGSALIQRWRVACGPEGLEGATITIAGLERTMVDVFVEFVDADGASRTHVLKPSTPSFVIGDETTQGTAGVASYFRFGVEHLLSGFDHILFIIGLVLLVRTPMALVKVVTSFTLAHSLTLALATLGIVSLPQNVVEAVIALSIVFLGVELVRKDRTSASLLMLYPWAITFVFGLLHGFGFAGALAETGLPQGAAALALLLFNLGVELGQLIIVALVLGVIAAARLLPAELSGKLTARARLVPAYGIGSFAGFWFIERTLSLF